MTRARILLSIILLAIGPRFPAHAHSWYPMECCSSNDCMPADAIGTDARGDLVVTVGSLRIWVPHGFAVRSSPDTRAHICFRKDETNFLMPMCLFVPAGS
jgi:hypothetical protein